MRQLPTGRVAGALALAGVLLATAACAGFGADPAAGDGRTRVTMATGNQGAVGAALKAIVDSFNSSQSDITVELQQYPDAKTLLQKNLVQLSAGDPATVTPCQPAWADAFAEAGALVDLSTLVGTPGGMTAADIADFDPVLMRAAQVRGRQYSLPYDRNVQMLYYNKDLFAEAGITAPPATWAEFADFAGRLTTGATWGADFYNAPQFTAVWDSALHSFGGRVLTDDQTRSAFDSDAGRQVTALWADLARKGHAKVVTDPLAGQLDFGAGRLGMHLADSTSVSFLQEAVGEKFEIGAAPLPAGPAGRFTELGGANICLFNKASEEVQRAGFRFISHLLSTDANADFVVASNYLPNRASTREKLAGFYADNPAHAIAVAELGNAVNPPTTKSWPEAGAALLVRLMGAFRGDEPVPSALDNAASEADRILSGTR